MVVEQLRAEVNFTRLRGLAVQREHAHPAAEAHPDVEELHVELAVFDVIPQRLLRIVLDAVIGLRR